MTDSPRSTNALRQIRALGNVSDQIGQSSSAGDGDKKKSKKKSKKRKSKKSKNAAGGTDMATDENKDADDNGDESDGMQVDKKTKEKEKNAASQASHSGVTDCCICKYCLCLFYLGLCCPKRCERRAKLTRPLCSNVNRLVLRHCLSSALHRSLQSYLPLQVSIINPAYIILKNIREH